MIVKLLAVGRDGRGKRRINILDRVYASPNGVLDKYRRSGGSKMIALEPVEPNETKVIQVHISNEVSTTVRFETISE